MSRSTLVIGVLAAVVLHAIVLLPRWSSSKPAPAAPATVPIDLSALPAPEPDAAAPDAPPPEPTAEPEPPAETEPSDAAAEPDTFETVEASARRRGEPDAEPPAEPPVESPSEPEPTPVAEAGPIEPEPAEPTPAPDPGPSALAQAEPTESTPEPVAPPTRPEPTPRASSVARLPGDPNGSDADDALPPMKITWRSPTEAQRVSRRLGLKIVAVDAGGDPLGEIAQTGPLALLPIDTNGERYSTRARVIGDPMFFGPGVQRAAAGRVAEFQLLVPVAVDREFDRLIRQAILAAGLRPIDVTLVEGRFVEGAGATDRDRLRIETLRVRGG